MKYMNDAAKQLGRKGGEATKEKHGLEHYRKIGKLSAKSRKKKKIEQAIKDQFGKVLDDLSTDDV